MEDSNFKKILAASQNLEKWISLDIERNPELVDTTVRTLRASARLDKNIVTGVWESECRVSYHHNGKLVTTSIVHDEDACTIAVHHAVQDDMPVIPLPPVGRVSVSGSLRARRSPASVPDAVAADKIEEVAQVLVNRTALHFPSIDALAYVVCEMQWCASSKEEAERLFVTEPATRSTVRLLIKKQGGITEALLQTLLAQLCVALEVRGQDKGDGPDVEEDADGDDADLVRQRQTRASQPVARQA